MKKQMMAVSFRKHLRFQWKLCCFRDPDAERLCDLKSPCCRCVPDTRSKLHRPDMRQHLQFRDWMRYGLQYRLQNEFLWESECPTLISQRTGHTLSRGRFFL